MKKIQKIICEKCGKDDFKSQIGLHLHARKIHPYIPPPEPKRTVETAFPHLPENHNLLGGRGRLGIGDIFYRVQKLVVIKTTITENSNDLNVVAQITKQHWQLNKPE